MFEKIVETFKKNPISKKLAFYKRMEQSLDEYGSDFDEPQLKRAVPPKDELLRLRSTWVSEVFTSSQTESLLRSISKLGWDKIDPANKHHDIASWIRHSRSAGDGQGWINGGVVREIKNANKSLMERIGSRYTKLPEGVEFAHLYIHKVSSSITVVVIQFVYKSDVSESINIPLNSIDYKPYLRYYPSKLRAKNVSYIGSAEQKKESLSDTLNTAHRPLYSWFNDNLPGYFSSGGSELPAVDFITTEKFKFKNDDDANIPEYLEPIFGYGKEHWVSEAKNGLRLLLPFYSRNNESNLLFGNEKELLKNTGIYGAQDKLTAMTGHIFHKTAVLLTVHRLLYSYTKDLLVVRDRASQRVRRLSKALSEAEYLRNNYLEKSKDIRLAAKELSLNSKSKYTPYDDLETFRFRAQPRNTYSEQELVDDIAKVDSYTASQLVILEDDMRDIMMSSATTGSTIANLRIQRLVFWLTVLATVFAAANIWMAIDSRPDIIIDATITQGVE